jgi:hypothetical protein
MRTRDHATPLYPQKLAPTSPSSGGRSVGIVRSRTKATELVSLRTRVALLGHSDVNPIFETCHIDHSRMHVRGRAAVDTSWDLFNLKCYLHSPWQGCIEGSTQYYNITLQEGGTLQVVNKHLGLPGVESLVLNNL